MILWIRWESFPFNIFFEYKFQFYALNFYHFVISFSFRLHSIFCCCRYGEKRLNFNKRDKISIHCRRYFYQNSSECLENGWKKEVKKKKTVMKINSDLFSANSLAAFNFIIKKRKGNFNFFCIYVNHLGIKLN